jgi:hypothetical protein
MDDDSGGAGRDGVERLGRLFEDLEQQAAGLHLAERDAELADRARGEYAAVTFASRIHASLAHEVALTLVTGYVVEGTLTQAGVDWCSVVKAEGQAVWLVRLGAVAAAYGLSSRAVPEAARPAVARLSFGSALHRLGVDHDEVLMQLASGASLRARVLRIGADFVEVESAGAAQTPTVIAFGAVLAVRV